MRTVTLTYVGTVGLVTKLDETSKYDALGKTVSGLPSRPWEGYN